MVRAARDGANANMEVHVRNVTVTLPWQGDTLTVTAQLPDAQFLGHRVGEFSPG